MKLKCILLIDDDQPINFLNEIIIKRARCAQNVVSVLSGADALRVLNGNIETTCRNPDVIFVDLNMPAMSGWEFLEEYRKLPARVREGTIVKILSSSVNPDDEALANETPGVHGFLNKPLTEEKLQQVLSTFFE